jgi:hypothetical protein
VPYKEITVEDFLDPKTKAIFTLPTEGDLLVRVQTVTEGKPVGPLVRMEASQLVTIGKAMADDLEQRQQINQ